MWYAPCIDALYFLPFSSCNQEQKSDSLSLTTCFPARDSSIISSGVFCVNSMKRGAQDLMASSVFFDSLLFRELDFNPFFHCLIVAYSSQFTKIELSCMKLGNHLEL